MMTWRDAFLRQARSDFAVWQKLGTPGVEYSHRLHYLQMVAEKSAKGLLCDPTSAAPPAPTHSAFVRLLQVLKTRPEIRRQLGYTDAAVFKRYLDSLLDLAAKIEDLAPSAAGFARPNPEYPWRDVNSGEIAVPFEFRFPEFDPKGPRMQKIDALIRALLRVAA
jgi:hypothetical protein